MTVLDTCCSGHCPWSGLRGNHPLSGLGKLGTEGLDPGGDPQSPTSARSRWGRGLSPAGLSAWQKAVPRRHHQAFSEGPRAAGEDLGVDRHAITHAVRPQLCKGDVQGDLSSGKVTLERGGERRTQSCRAETRAAEPGGAVGRCNPARRHPPGQVAPLGPRKLTSLGLGVLAAERGSEAVGAQPGSHEDRRSGCGACHPGPRPAPQQPPTIPAWHDPRPGFFLRHVCIS